MEDNYKYPPRTVYLPDDDCEPGKGLESSIALLSIIFFGLALSIAGYIT